MRSLGAVIVLAGCCVLGACNDDDQDTTAGRSDVVTMQVSDAGWMQDVAQSNLAEIRMADMATTQAQSEEVRRFARRLVNDHTNLTNELKSIAREDGVALPAALDEHHREKSSMLARAQGSEFDREFMSMMVESHRKSVEKFEAAAASAADDELRSFADRSLPTLREHLRMAEDLAAQVGARK